MAFKFLGKLLIISAIVIIGHHNLYAGLALLLCVILLDNNSIIKEGMENKDEEAETGSDADDTKPKAQAVPSFKSNGVAAIGKSQNATSTSKVANQGKGQQKADSICDDCIGDSDLPDHCSKCPCNGTPCAKSKLSDVDEFKTKYCLHGKLMKDDKEIDIADIATVFPQVKYVDDDDKCNICSDDCKFDIINSKEQLHTEENIRASDSNKVQVDHKKAVTSEESPEAY